MTDDAPPLVFIVDDDDLVRLSIADLLESMHYQTKAFPDPEAFLSFKREPRPSCIILDVRMPSMSGMDFHQLLRRQNIGIPIVFITGHGDIAMGVEAMKRGAVDFLTKPFKEQDLIDAVQRGIRFDKERLAAERERNDLQEKWQSLTEGEKTVAQQVVRGRLNKQIAFDLELSEITIKVRRRRIFEKLNISSLAELIKFMDAINRS